MLRMFVVLVALYWIGRAAKHLLFWRA